MSATLWLTRGLPASGKTTWARDMVDKRPAGSIIRLNRDDLRAMALPSGYTVPVHDAEERVTTVQQAPIVGLLRAGVDVIVDDTNLRVRHVKRLAQIAVQAGASWECVDHFLTVEVDECIMRDKLRPRPVGEQVIRRMHTKFLSGGRTLPLPAFDEVVTGKPYHPVPGTPRAVIVDIDGTVAKMDGRSPYDPTLYHTDLPNQPVIDTVTMAWQAGHRIVFCSGRSEDYRNVTEQWINDHVLPQGARWELHMRPSGDTRNDAVVKLELFDEHIRHRFDVRFVLDDRDRVVAGWRSMGLTVYQVAPGSF